MAFLISPSLLMNSVYIKSALLALQTALKGGSLTSSIGAIKGGLCGGLTAIKITLIPVKSETGSQSPEPGLFSFLYFAA